MVLISYRLVLMLQREYNGACIQFRQPWCLRKCHGIHFISICNLDTSYQHHALYSYIKLSFPPTLSSRYRRQTPHIMSNTKTLGVVINPKVPNPKTQFLSLKISKTLVSFSITMAFYSLGLNQAIKTLTFLTSGHLSQKFTPHHM